MNVNIIPASGISRVGLRGGGGGSQSRKFKEEWVTGEVAGEGRCHPPDLKKTTIILFTIVTQ